jgi:hypothetical protein
MTTIEHNYLTQLQEDNHRLQGENGMLLQVSYEAVRKLQDEVDHANLRVQGLLSYNNEMLQWARDFRNVLWVLCADGDYTMDELMKAFEDGRKLLGLPPEKPEGQHEGETNGRTQVDGQPGEDVAGAEAGEPEGRRSRHRRRSGHDPD